MKIADVSIRRPVFAVMMISALIVFGIFSYPRIGVDLFPNVEFPVITVTVVYPGADPAAMESKVADPIEEAVNTMAGIKELRSVNLESVTQARPKARPLGVYGANLGEILRMIGINAPTIRPPIMASTA